MSSVIAKCRTCGHTPLHSSDELEDIIRIPCELCHEKVYFFCPICRLPETRPEESLGGKPPPETFVRKGVVWVGKVFVGVGCGIYVWNSTGQTITALPIVLFGVFIGVLIGAFLDRTIGRWISIKFRKFGTIFLYPALLCVALFFASTGLIPVPFSKVATLTVVSNVQYSAIYVDSVRRESAPTAIEGDLTRLDLDLSPGLHTIKVTKPGYDDFEEQIDLKDDDTLLVALTKSTTTSTASSSSGYGYCYDRKINLFYKSGSAGCVSTDKKISKREFTNKRLDSSSTTATASSSLKIWCATKYSVSETSSSSCTQNRGKIFVYKRNADAEHRRLKGAPSTASSSRSGIVWCATIEDVKFVRLSVCRSEGGQSFSLDNSRSSSSSFTAAKAAHERLKGTSAVSSPNR